MAKKQRQKKTPLSKKARPTIRFEPEVHARLDKVADNFGMTLSSVVSYLVLRGLGRMELEAKVYLEAMEKRDLHKEMTAWVRAKPGRTRNEFILATIERLMNEPSPPPPPPPIKVTEELLERLTREAQESLKRSE